MAIAIIITAVKLKTFFINIIYHLMRVTKNHIYDEAVFVGVLFSFPQTPGHDAGHQGYDYAKPHWDRPTGDFCRPLIKQSSGVRNGDDGKDCRADSGKFHFIQQQFLLSCWDVKRNDKRIFPVG